jgi:uncharacterized protein
MARTIREGTGGESTVTNSGVLTARIREEMTSALKAGEKVTLGALRMLLAAIKNREVELGHELSDDEVRDVAAKEVKKRTESIEAFEAAGRSELVERETAERETIAVYAPAPLSEAEVDALVDEAIAEAGASSIKEMGKVMGAVMARIGRRADGSVVQAKVRERLGGSEDR